MICSTGWLSTLPFSGGLSELQFLIFFFCSNSRTDFFKRFNPLNWSRSYSKILWRAWISFEIQIPVSQPVGYNWTWSFQTVKVSQLDITYNYHKKFCQPWSGWAADEEKIWFFEFFSNFSSDLLTGVRYPRFYRPKYSGSSRRSIGLLRPKMGRQTSSTDPVTTHRSQKRGRKVESNHSFYSSY